MVYSFFGNVIFSNSRRGISLGMFFVIDETPQVPLINISLCCSVTAVGKKNEMSKSVLCRESLGICTTEEGGSRMEGGISKCMHASRQITLIIAVGLLIR